MGRGEVLPVAPGGPEAHVDVADVDIAVARPFRLARGRHEIERLVSGGGQVGEGLGIGAQGQIEGGRVERRLVDRREHGGGFPGAFLLLIFLPMLGLLRLRGETGQQAGGQHGGGGQQQGHEGEGLGKGLHVWSSRRGRGGLAGGWLKPGSVWQTGLTIPACLLSIMYTIFDRDNEGMKANRREWMAGVAALAICAVPLRGFAAVVAPRVPLRAKPLPLTDVRLRPSAFATAVEVNIEYLMSLEPDRFLHNFRKYAGLEPKAPIYGGWESDTIAGHSLGHYMSALVLAWQQTGNPECRRRADYIVGELALCQAQRHDGYIGALGRKTKDGAIVDGEAIFPEVMRGEIKSGGFDLNGSWSPLYTVHKYFAGLLDIHAAWGNPEALRVAIGLAGYFEKVFAALDDAQMQDLLGCEYGGLNESYAELYARTGDARWMAVAERIFDRKVLGPLVAQEDRLANFHANTQVPKLIGLARIHELTGKDDPGRAARFFWERVTQHHSYVIGGNADREYFFAPDTIALHLTESTCEHCNTYNMLKLTRQLYGWQPDGALFDYYERAHLNHVLSAQNPATGGFTYMTPMMSGAARGYSQPGEEVFWCCVGSGMESHAKHGDSIYWTGHDGAGGDTLFVNLYIPSTMVWQDKG
jgi:hypothetical protein